MLAYRRLFRRGLIVVSHAVIVAFCVIGAFLIRFDLAIPDTVRSQLGNVIILALCVKLVVFWAARLDRGFWRFLEIQDVVRLLVANGTASFIYAMMLALSGMASVSIPLIDFLLCFLLMSAARAVIQLCKGIALRERRMNRKHVLVYGAGSAGRNLLREFHENPRLGYEAVGLLDDDPAKRWSELLGVPILGTGREAGEIVKRFRRRGLVVDELIIAMPAATGRQMREAAANCRAAEVPCKTIPGTRDLLTRGDLSSQIRNISVTDLLGREPVQLDDRAIAAGVAGRAVMVTGGAGSIGSELCRQLAALYPRELVVYDQAESDLFRIELELRNRYPSLDLVARVGDICDATRVDETIRAYGIESIFHAAAYKHVPMMEANASEAIRNNVLGTWNLAHAARRRRVSRFVMISSDKAVNPTSVMGATKRAAEHIVSALQTGGHPCTTFVSVRFGNVLGSNGSVLPLFQAQISAGGPVTVTHPDIRRYFMTIPEAVQLVLQASTMGVASEVFVLDMGEPVRILDLANHMIRLAGLVPGEDIEVRFTGLRPGERLYEELVAESEQAQATGHDKIRRIHGPCLDLEDVQQWISALTVLLDERDERRLIDHLRKVVPEYRPAAAVAAEVPDAVAEMAGR